MNKAEFSIIKFNSGEYEVKLINRVDISQQIIVPFNWFENPDIFLIKLMIDALKHTTGADNLNIKLVCNYLPYSRQDRIFAGGLGVPIIALIKFIQYDCRIDKIEVIAMHNKLILGSDLINHKAWISLDEDDYKENKIIPVFPDKNAITHFCLKSPRSDNDVLLTFKKERDAITGKVKLERDDENSTFYGFEDGGGDFVIFDDICDGGRTFVECAKVLKDELYADNIELTVYHAFLTHGIKELMDSGITKIHIINPDSYEYVCKKFPDNKDYFVLSSL